MAETAVSEQTTQVNQDEKVSSSTEGTKVQAANFADVQEKTVSGKAASIDILLDMQVPVTVVIGQTEISIQRLLQLSCGSVLKLDKPIDMPVELYLKDSMFATGSIVVVEDKFAVKIKEILTSKSPHKTENN